MSNILTSLLCSCFIVITAGKTHANDFPLETTDNVEMRTGSLEYQVRMESTRLKDQDGRYSADVVNTTYLATSEGDIRDRPIIFLFNGGPIAPSVYLHMGLLGPYRVEVTTEPHEASIDWELKINPDTLLDIVDLVYVDPPMTGFSRLADDRNQRDFHSVDADSQQVADFIANWLHTNNRTDSPIFLFGESYGTIRAPMAARKLVNDYELENVRGVMLFGQAVNMVEYAQRPDNILSYIVSLPPLTLIAQYHGKSAYGDVGIDTLYQKVQRFSEETYLPALYKGSLISTEELQRVAKQLEAFTGISAQYYIDNRLRISKSQFRQELLREEGMVLGMYDARYAGPADDDSPTDPSGPLGQIFIDAYETYRHDQLDISTDLEYALRADVRGLGDWEWGGNNPFSHFNYAANIDYLFDQLNEFRVYVGSGLYDLSTTTGGADYLLQQRNWPAEHVMLKRYIGGHMAYTDSESAAAMANDIRAFILGDFAPAVVEPLR